MNAGPLKGESMCNQGFCMHMIALFPEEIFHSITPSVVSGAQP